MLDIGNGPMVTSHGDLLPAMREFIDPSRRRSRKTQEKEDVERWQQTVATTRGCTSVVSVALSIVI